MTRRQLRRQFVEVLKAVNEQDVEIEESELKTITPLGGLSEQSIRDFLKGKKENSREDSHD